MLWHTARGILDLTQEAAIMGILNVTPDSFSDGGRFGDDLIQQPLAAALAMIHEGAAIIDVGGESTRPGAESISVEEETARVLPVVRALARRVPSLLISVDTSKAAVAEAALAAGAAIINDVTALRGDPRMAEVACRHHAGVVLMHMLGTPRTMQDAPAYQDDDVTGAVQDFFCERFAFALRAGLEPARLAFDPGLGFGKTAAHNLTLCRCLDQLAANTPAGRPIVFGASRKRFVAQAAKLDPARPPTARDAATAALSALAREKGARVLRVHAVRPNVEAVRAAESVMFA
jgi:dihydropteroate synthase